MLNPTITTTQAQVDDMLLDALPSQGYWSEEDYLWVTDHSNRLIEYTDGYIEVLPMPTLKHQTILKRLLLLFLAWVEPLGGIVVFAPLRLRVRQGKFREPDLLALQSAADPRCQDRFWLGADLVLEVVSPDDPQRDLIEKRQDYAEAGIAEYWIVDAQPRTITVLTLVDDGYVEHGVFGLGDQATSILLEGLSVEVNSIFIP